MKKYYLLLILLFFTTICIAQIKNSSYSKPDTSKIKVKPPPPPPPPPPAPQVEEIFRVVENHSRFLRSECEKLKTKSEIIACAEAAFTKFIYDQLKYPEEAFKKRIEGYVFAEFVVDRNGNIKEPKIVSEIGGGCGEEVLRIINICPKWKPNGPRGRQIPLQAKIAVKFDRKAWKRKLKQKTKK